MSQIIFHAPVMKIRSQRIRSTPCTLLLPSHLAQFVSGQRFGDGLPGFSAYLRVLVRTYRFRTIANGTPRKDSLAAKYQGTGLSLKRVHFRPEAHLWHQVTILARYLGVSRCHLIVLMIEWDAGLESPPSEVGVPTTLRGGIQDHECLILEEKIHTWEDPYSRRAMIGLDPDMLQAYLASPFRRKHP